MNLFLFLELISLTFASLLLDFNKQCECSEYKLQKECENTKFNCLWENKKCRNKECKENSNQEYCEQQSKCIWNSTCEELNCSNYITEKQCDDLHPRNNCAWNTSDKCAQFTTCADYKPGGTGCILKSSSTQDCQKKKNEDKCENTTIFTCGDYKTDTCQYSSPGGPCFFKDDTACLKLTQCNQITDPNICEAYENCVYETNCRDKMCSDYITDFSCIYVRNIFNKTGTLCEWNDNKCADAVDTSKLQIAYCNTNTINTYTWDSDLTKCILCGQLTVVENIYVLVQIVSLLFIIFI